MKIIDLNGKIIGDWTVLSKSQAKHKQTRWLVKCKCGIEKVLSSQNIRNTTCCRDCVGEKLSIKLKSGDVFHKWTIVGPAESKNGKRWQCKCACGEEYIIATKTLMSGKSKCCFKCGRYKLRKFVGAVPQWMITQTRLSAQSRNLEFKLNIEYLVELFKKQNGECALTGLELSFSTSPKKVKENTASIDRIDNTKGYLQGNIRFVHKVINIMRKSMSDLELLKWCRLVVNHNVAL